MKGLYSMDGKQRIAVFSSVDPSTSCWLWKHTMCSNGYGILQFRAKRYLAHRLSYESYVGQIPKGLDLDHKCRVRHCVNPEHLEPVTRSVNVLRGLVSTAHNWDSGQSARTHCPQGHEYTPENTRTYKTSRKCRECARILAVDYYQRNRETVLQKLRDKTKAERNQI